MNILGLVIVKLLPFLDDEWITILSRASPRNQHCDVHVKLCVMQGQVEDAKHPSQNGLDLHLLLLLSYSSQPNTEHVKDSLSILSSRQ